MVERDPAAYVRAIRESGLSIYDPVTVGDPDLWIPAPELEMLLGERLTGRSVAGLANRTRSKLVKQWVCDVMGYPAPDKFQRVKPRLPGPAIDVFSQKNVNLQPWNPEISPIQRIVVIRVSENGILDGVRVITGDTLSQLDTTKTLTRKFQARCLASEGHSELVSFVDTSRVRSWLNNRFDLAQGASPTSAPVAGEILSIDTVFTRLSQLIGERFDDPGADQERNRGGVLHELVCRRLGYRDYQDNGQFPDVRHQLIEVKLQTADTIDLGMISPASDAPLDIPMIDGFQIQHQDVRYAVFCGRRALGSIELTSLILTTGADFFSRFPQCGGNVSNAKLQIRLPRDFFA